MTDWFGAVHPHLPLSAGVSVTMGLTGWMVRGGGSALLATVFSASFRSVRVTPCQYNENGSHKLRNTATSECSRPSGFEHWSHLNISDHTKIISDKDKHTLKKNSFKASEMTAEVFPDLAFNHFLSHPSLNSRRRCACSLAARILLFPHLFSLLLVCFSDSKCFNSGPS